VLELTGKKEPQDGLQGKFSVYNGFVLGLMFGRAGEGEYTDEIVRREDVIALRRKVNATGDGSIDETAADVKVTLKGGRTAHVFVEHAIGSLEKPMSDKDLEAKFHGLADPVIGKAKADALIAACWKLAAAKDVRALCEGARP
jgi:2-methylcitrate dehydratase PrpD